MTRFARAKGSKASNLKTPEDSTPWEVMKEHMLRAKTDTEECKKREEAEQQRIDNYNNFLKEHKTQKRKATWCDFPETANNNNTILNTVSTHINGKKKSRVEKAKSVNDSEISHNEKINSNQDSNSPHTKETEEPKKKKKKNKKNKLISESLEIKQDSVPPADENLSSKEQKKNTKKKKLLKSSISTDEISNPEPTNTITQNPSLNDEEEINPKVSLVSNKKKKNKQNKKQFPDSNETERKTNDNLLNTQTESPFESESINIEKNIKKKGKGKRRKPIDDKSFQFIINGKEVKLIRFDGFPIMKKDAERLEELKKNMVKKGIPKSEVQRTMKLERRRAEKALARMKREVCYNCRKGGHNLSDCPDLKSHIPNVNAAEGICFKCGSTEHRQFECKVQRDNEFRFATCFICKEPGHIARQCPDNAKGLYPNGGCCKLCGDVTHLRKDCPTVQDKREETSIKLQTLNDDNIEDISYQRKPVAQETIKKPKKIKF